MPGPPPGAILAVGSTGFVVAVVDVLTAGGVTATGEGEGGGKSAFDRNQERLAGLGEAATGETAGAGVAATAGEASFFKRLCLTGLGETSALAAGDMAGTAVAAGEGSFLERLCLATLGEDSGVGDGDWPSNVTRENPVKAIMKPTYFFMTDHTAAEHRGNPKIGAHRTG